jgi:hypothetical protein
VPGQDGGEIQPRDEASPNLMSKDALQGHVVQGLIRDVAQRAKRMGRQPSSEMLICHPAPPPQCKPSVHLEFERRKGVPNQVCSGQADGALEQQASLKLRVWILMLPRLCRLCSYAKHFVLYHLSTFLLVCLITCEHGRYWEAYNDTGLIM